MGRHRDLERRTELLDEVVGYLGRNGVARVSLRPVARALGVSVNALVHHFGSKDELVVAALRRAAEIQRGVEGRWRRQEPHLSTAELQRRWWRWINRSPEHLALVRLGLEAATLDATVSGLPGDVRAEQISFWREDIADGLIADGIKPEDAEREASLVKATFTGLVLDLLATGHRKRLTDALECTLRRLDDLTGAPLRLGPEPLSPMGQACPVGVPRSTLITRIGELVTNDKGQGGFAATMDAALVIEDGTVAWTGPASRAPAADFVVDAGGRAVLPGFVDSHAHLVFAGERSAEFAARMAGRPYRAGGILTTVAATRAASEEALRANLRRLAAEMLRQGTTTFECKSGYGLTVADEARALALAAEITPEVTYLGAHVVPPEFAGNTAGYVDLVRGPMLDACAPHARWIDVFCEDGAFGADEAAAVLAAGRARGLGARVHANQLGPGPGVRVAAEAGAASADHCTYLSEADVEAIVSAPMVATLLPGAEFGTRHTYPDARRLLDAGAVVALATDCNPGSSFTSSMAFCIALAVREMRMTTQEAIWAATAGGAAALCRSDVGHLGVGASADLIVLDAPVHSYLAYRPGVPLVAAVWRAGRLAAGAL
jgi:imidazolonepropionase